MRRLEVSPASSLLAPHLPFVSLGSAKRDEGKPTGEQYQETKPEILRFFRKRTPVMRPAKKHRHADPNVS